MTIEPWVFVLIFAAAVAAAFLAGRWTSPSRKRAEAVERELDGARTELEDVRRNVNGHFEQSARLFGRLAEDYRALYEHFSDTAAELGYNDFQTEPLLEEERRPLLSESPDSDEAGESGARRSSAPQSRDDAEAPEEVLRSREAEG